jgi:hypothetical protein
MTKLPDLKWTAAEDEVIPLDADIIVRHAYGTDAIHYIGLTWRYWYTNEEVPKSTMDSVTHFCKV